MRRETVGVTESLLQAAKEPIRYWRIFTGTRKNFSFCSAIRREQNMKIILTNSRQSSICKAVCKETCGSR